MKEPLTTCGRCGWPYPDEYLEVVHGSLVKERVCALCALEIVNAVHGTRMVRFHGEIAESLRLSAADWRLQHPGLKPKELG